MNESAIGALSALCGSSDGVFRGRDAVNLGITRNRLRAFVATGVIERVLPDTYRMIAVRRSNQQSLRAALLWAGPGAAAAGRSAGALYGLEGVHATKPEIVLASGSRIHSDRVVVHHVEDRKALMVRREHGLAVTGVETTLVALAHALKSEQFEVACEDARRRRLTSVPSLRSYLSKFAARGRPGVAAVRDLLDELDPKYPARSTLEVKTRRLLGANGLTGFVREFPLEWNGRTYRFDFAFEHRRTILETNGRRWHDDPNDYEHDNEKWSVPGRHGFRIVFATWEKVTRAPNRLLTELETTLAA